MALPDYVRNANDEAAFRDGYVYDHRYALEQLEFFPRFVNHYVGEYAGKPFVPLDWQRERVLLPAFGWVHQDEKVGHLKRRRFRKVSLWIPKKNGKSTLCAAVGLKLMTEAPGANVFTCATDGKHARIVHSGAIKMVRVSPKLDAALRVRLHESLIYDPVYQSEYTTLSYDPDRAEGYDASGLIIDELHAWPHRKFWEVIVDSGAARRNHMTWIISTAGEKDASSIGYEQYLVAKDVSADRRIDYRHLPILFEAAEDDDIHSPQVWARCNPSLGSVLDVSEMAEKSALVKSNPREERTFRRRRLNQWVGMAKAWIMPDAWQSCYDPQGVADAFGGDSKVLYAGFDLSDTDDLTALVLVCCSNDRVYLRPLIWVSLDTIDEKEKSSGADYSGWLKQGHVRGCKGRYIRDDDILAGLDEVLQRDWIEQLAYDPAQAGRLIRLIKDTYGVDCRRFLQTNRSYNEPCRYFERCVNEQRLSHDGNDALSWTVLNMAVDEDRSEHLRPIKPGNDAKKIDPGCAAIMGLAAWMFSPEGVGSFAWS